MTSQGNNSILLSWPLSEGATQYQLTQKFNETSFQTFNLTNVNSTLIENLPQSIPFIFTIYSGNDFGFDLSEGASGNFSTDSSFFFFFSFHFISFHFISSFFYLS